MNQPDAAAFRRRLLTHPGERQEVDYKASKPFDGDDSFTLKLIRHIQGMANSGGGRLVIGMMETPTGFVPDAAHTDAVSSSYDPTVLSQRVDSSVARGQRVTVTVYPEIHPDTGLRYPIIRVDDVVRSPCVCRSDRAASDTGDTILRSGVVYLRRPGAETAPVSTPQDWEDVISRAVRSRREEFLEEFRELIDRMNSPRTALRSATEELRTFAEQMRVRRDMGNEPRHRID